MNEELLKEIISMLSEEILRREYSKDMLHETELCMLANGEFDKYAAMKRGEHSQF